MTSLNLLKVRLREMNQIATTLQSLGQTEAAQRIRQQIEDLNKKWTDLQQLATQRAQQLGSAHEVQRFHRYFVVPIMLTEIRRRFLQRCGRDERVDPGETGRVGVGRLRP